jgi:hypothetical protein
MRLFSNYPAEDALAIVHVFTIKHSFCHFFLGVMEQFKPLAPTSYSDLSPFLLIWDQNYWGRLSSRLVWGMLIGEFLLI